MIYGFAFPDTKEFITAVCAADTFQEFTEFVDRIRVSLNENSTVPNCRDFRIVEAFEYFMQPVLEDFSFKSPTILFTHDTVADRDAFVKDHNIELLTNKFRGHDRQTDMLYAEEERLDDEANKGKTIAEITGLVDGAYDPWDQRSDEQKEQDRIEKEKMEALKAEKAASEAALKDIINGSGSQETDEGNSAESSTDDKAKIGITDAKISKKTENDGSVIDVDIEAVSTAESSAVEVKSSVDIMNEVLAENSELLQEITSDDLAIVIGGDDPTSDAMGVGDGAKYRRKSLTNKGEKDDEYLSELSPAAKKLREIYQEKLAAQRKKENELFEAERDEQEKEDARNGIFHGADLLGDLEDVDTLDIADTLKKIADDEETKVEHVKYPFNSVIGDNIFIPHIPKRVEATENGLKIIDDGLDIIDSVNLSKVGQLTLGASSVMVVKKTDPEKEAWVVFSKYPGKARKVVHIR